MSTLSSYFTSAKPTSFGVNVRSVNGLPTDLETMKGSIQKTNKQYRDEITKYKEIAKFNQKISDSYIKNLEVMVDISKVLNYYVEIFSVLRDELEKSAQEMESSGLKAADIGYLEKITRQQIDQLNNNFMVEADKLQKIYSQFGKQAEAARLGNARQNLSDTISGAETALLAIKEKSGGRGKNRRYNKRSS